jgi:tetratricopeptide (TPR) repeat protein
VTRLQGKISLALAALLWLASTPGGVLHADGGRKESRAEQAESLWKEGAVLHLEKRYGAAIEHFNRSLALQPSARTHTYLAWSLSELERYEEAAAEARKAIELEPDYPNAYNDLGSYLIELKRPGKAIPLLEKAAEMEGYCCPHYAYYQMGRARLMQGRVEAAEEALTIAIKIRPRYRAAHDLLRRIREDGLQGL